MNALFAILLIPLQALFFLYLLAIVMRFLLQLVRADFYNPVSQFLVKITNPLLLPLRRIVPGYAGVDFACIVLALLVQMIGTELLVFMKYGGLVGIVPLMVASVFGLLALLLTFYFFAILLMIILSWVAPGTNSPAVLLLYQLTEPVMAPFRRIIPPLGGLDLSPIVVFIVITMLEEVLRQGAMAAGVAGLVPWLGW